jgi:DegV family protein with EDD domain
VRTAAERVRDQALSLLVVDDLSHLKRGGRLTGAQAAVGSVLRVKPVLHVVDGRVEIRERARTWQRALELLVDTAAEHAAGRPVQVVVVHAVAADRAEQLARRLRQRLDVVEILETLMGPIVGTHVGPGAVGLALVPLGADDPAG